MYITISLVIILVFKYSPKGHLFFLVQRESFVAQRITEDIVMYSLFAFSGTMLLNFMFPQVIVVASSQGSGNPCWAPYCSGFFD